METPRFKTDVSGLPNSQANLTRYIHYRAPAPNYNTINYAHGTNLESGIVNKAGQRSGWASNDWATRSTGVKYYHIGTFAV